MKKTFFLILLTLVTLPGLKAQMIEAQLGDSSFVSLLTCGPGEEFYTTWGHSAIRVCDSTLNIDLVYNYGTFDFSTKNFYLKFAQGRLDYCISRDRYSDFIGAYNYERRSVWEQHLNLTRQERNNLFILLEHNYLPENRYYKYDFFRDNCATRIRDIINGSLCHRYVFEPSDVENAVTYRDLLYAPTEKLLWWRLGVDLLLGQRCDKLCNSNEYLFSPMEMMVQTDTTAFKIKDANGKLIPQVDSLGNTMFILGEKRQLLNSDLPPIPKSFSPTLCFWLLFIIVLALTIFGWAKQKRLVWLDEILFWIVSLLSILFILMWFATNHYCTKLNWNILWANPFFIYYAIRLRKSNKVVLYFGMLLELVTLIGFWFLPQSFNAAVFPIALTLFIRLLDKCRNINN